MASKTREIVSRWCGYVPVVPRRLRSRLRCDLQLPILAASNQKESVMGATVRTSIAPLAGRVAR
ncbi:hypothetical protein M0657_006271 [Pyricularia oryzae]|uniref:Uncharacterized protein n=1 Tax=Pyricularia oryzae TaxID=318829 RepID=A0A4P7NFM8_PYROR|nr:hypothetical protein M0657_006271 [Pyricularia oryzae]KAI7921162.1 hypothetical protein M9X92_005572 [Pyricularia oryzae]QBZ60701.1 hypothetical protein PoMZ_07642 [Pyricularia oryzae]